LTYRMTLVVSLCRFRNSMCNVNRQLSYAYQLFSAGAMLLLFYVSTQTLCGSLPSRCGVSSECGWRRRPPDMEGVCGILNKQSRIANKGRSSSLGSCGRVGGNLLTVKNKILKKSYTGPRTRSNK